MYLVNPKDRQRYFIRLLLLHVKGATSFENLRTVNCVMHPTIYEAAVAKQHEQDEEWDRCLKEEWYSFLRHFVNYFHLFVFIIILLMQENYTKNTKFSSIIPNMKKSIVDNIALNIIHKNLQINGYSSTDYKLPDISTYIEEYNDDTFYEKCNTLNEVHLKINTLKTNQKNIFSAVLESLK